MSKTPEENRRVNALLRSGARVTVIERGSETSQKMNNAIRTVVRGGEVEAASDDRSVENQRMDTSAGEGNADALHAPLDMNSLLRAVFMDRGTRVKKIARNLQRQRGKK